MQKILRIFGFISRFISIKIKKFKKYSLKKKAIAVLAGLIIFLILSSILGNIGKKPPYTTARVERGDIIEKVSEVGTITTGGRTDVYSPTDGIIIEIFVKNGDIVKEGQNLFNVKSSASQQEEQAAYSNYLTTQATLNSAESNLNVLRADMYGKWNTFRDLATGDEFETSDNKSKDKERLESPTFQISQDNWLAAEKKYKDQQTVVAQGRAQTASTWLLYQATQDTMVTAPLSGTISNLSINTGGSVSAFSQSLLAQTPKAALIISNSSTAEVEISLSENDITKIKEGQEASVDIDAITSKTYKGVISRVDSIGTLTDGVIRYSVYLEILNPDGNIRSGMGSDNTITTNKLQNVLTVPNSAIKPYQGGKGIRIPSKSGEVKYVPVVVGIKGEARTEIIKGLSQGEEIITSVSNEGIQRAGLFGN